MKIDVLTLFPEMFSPVLQASILGRATAKGILSICLTNIRDFTKDKHRVVDDYPFGGGAGMVMKVEPLVLAVESVIARVSEEVSREPKVVLLSPGGYVFTQDTARRLALEEHLVIICGHYEGVDQRVTELLKAEEISIGDYVLTGGEIPAMVLIDSVSRLLPGVLGSEESSLEESFTESHLLEYPHYTRPREFRGAAVPDVLLSGNHGEISRWRRGQALKRTAERRPDLLAKYVLTKDDIKCLKLVESRREG